MDVTPQVINEVEFHQKMRGYDPDEVDDFLERVAVAVEQLQSRIREAEQRTIAAERRAEEVTDAAKGAPATAVAPSPARETDDTEAIRRTLVLAQRTADAAIKEAEEDAKRTLQGAQEQVQRLYTEAQDQARKLVIDAESEARKTADDTRQRLVKEIITLEETRDSLRADQGILERHLDEQRLRLRSSIGELQRLLDDPGRLRAGTAPELSGATRPDFVTDPPAADAADAVDTVDAPEVADENVRVAVRDESDDVVDDGPMIDLGSSGPITGSVTYTPADDDGDEWSRFANGALDGPPTMAVRASDVGDDAYMTELRKAMLEDTSASSLEPGEHRARTRFGRRR
jgi:DivIVA domain-containing protein